MNNSNELLRSVYQVAMRYGEDTNWIALQNKLRSELLLQQGLPENTDDEQLILRSTCTPKTFQFRNYVVDKDTQ